MGRSWKDVKADKEAIDRAAGRDVEASRAAARSRTQAYVLGFRLAELRKKAGLTQVDVAERMGVSQARISQLEQGARGGHGAEVHHRARWHAQDRGRHRR